MPGQSGEPHRTRRASGRVIGRKVKSSWHRMTGVVLEWNPLSAAMTDVRVREDGGRECWYSSSDLAPDDDAGPLPSRAVAREWARVRALDDLLVIRAQHISDFHKPWPGLEYGKTIMGQSIDGAIRELLGEEV